MPCGHLQLIHDFAQFGALIAFDAARNTTTTRIVGHQHKVTAGQADEGGQGGALVAAFVFVDLNDQFLAFFAAHPGCEPWPGSTPGWK
jgi:hypothetical protein